MMVRQGPSGREQATPQAHLGVLLHVDLARVTYDGRRLGRRIPKVAITAHRASQWSVVDSET
jgi:hypothetical protein